MATWRLLLEDGTDKLLKDSDDVGDRKKKDLISKAETSTRNAGKVGKKGGKKSESARGKAWPQEGAEGADNIDFMDVTAAKKDMGGVTNEEHRIKLLEMTYVSSRSTQKIKQKRTEDLRDSGNEGASTSKIKTSSTEIQRSVDNLEEPSKKPAEYSTEHKAKESIEAGQISNFNQLNPGDLIEIEHGLKWLKCNQCVVHKIDDISEDGQTATLTISDNDNKSSKHKSVPVRLQRRYVLLKKVRYNENKFSPFVVNERAKEFEEHFKPNPNGNQDANDNADSTNDNDKSGNSNAKGSGGDDSGKNQNSKIEKIKYHLLRQNCEHFASTCINGPDDVQQVTIKEAISVQAHDFIQIVFSVFMFLCSGVFFGINFWMYAVFVRKDCTFEFLNRNRGSLYGLCNFCYQGHDKCAEFIPLYIAKNCSEAMSQTFEGTHVETICDWCMIGIFVFKSLILSTILACLYRKNKYMCNRCFDSLCIHEFFSRNVSISSIEALSIVFEEPLYSAVTQWKLDRGWTVIMLIIVSTFGAMCIYALSSVITKVLVLVISTDRVGFWKCLGLWKCASNCCKSTCCQSSCCETYSGKSPQSGCPAWKGYDKYVRFRGCVLCCFRNAKSKYLQPSNVMPSREEACMVCRLEIPIYNFNQIEPGDHISMPGTKQFANLFYNHHAIVTKVDNVSKDGKEAHIEVIDVPHKGKDQLPVIRHSLYDANRHRLTSSMWMHCYCDGVRIMKKKMEECRPVGQRDGYGSIESASEEPQTTGRLGASDERWELQDLSKGQTVSHSMPTFITMY